MVPFLVAASSQGWQFFGPALANSRWFTRTDTPKSIPVWLISRRAVIFARQASECDKAREVIAKAALAHSVREKTEGAHRRAAYSLAPSADFAIQAPTRNALSLIGTKRPRT